jgi:hypothetical protein
MEQAKAGCQRGSMKVLPGLWWQSEHVSVSACALAYAVVVISLHILQQHLWRKKRSIMTVVRQRAGVLLLVLALAVASGSCAQQDSREAHIQLQSSAKASSDAVIFFAKCACCAF